MKARHSNSGRASEGWRQNGRGYIRITITEAGQRALEG
jgi:hypothetical protein